MDASTSSEISDRRTAPVGAGDLVETRTDRVNLRAWMSTSAPVRCTLRRGERAVVLDEPFRFERRDWVRVRLADSGEIGCIAMQLLGLVESGHPIRPIDPVLPQDGIYRAGDYLVTRAHLPLVGDPEVNSSIVHEIEWNSVGIALDEPAVHDSIAWVPVRFPDGSGWIEARHAQLLARECQWIEVDLSTQTLTARNDASVVSSSRVSTGKRGYPTPDGAFTITEKLPVRRLRGSVRGEDWDIAAVPWIMVFRHSGFYLHAAYWHDDFGQPASHGCVTLPVDFAEWLYDWTPVGTPIWIHF